MRNLHSFIHCYPLLRKTFALTNYDVLGAGVVFNYKLGFFSFFDKREDKNYNVAN